MSFSKSLRIVSRGQKIPIIEFTQMTNYLTWVNHWDHFSFLAFVQITTVYGFSPWRGQIFEIFESKGPWYDLMNDLVNPTLPISSPNRLVFLRFFEVFWGFRSFWIASFDLGIEKDLTGYDWSIRSKKTSKWKPHSVNQTSKAHLYQKGD